MKKLLSSFMIATALGSAAYAPKSQAGFVLFAAPTITGIALAGNASGIMIPALLASFGQAPGIIGFAGQVIGIGGMIAGPIAMATGNLIPGIVVLVLDENGSLPQGQLESILAEKYNFIADREVISTLASTIKSKADLMEADAQGMKMVSLSEDQVKNILAPAELTQDEVTAVVQDLK